ncbi:TPA: type 1 glutamine amidotransferase [Candidatus Woesearchaeota archaeon]|nr:type 1 glutamine amidotransferase [Candidatus Woesearchaeota archaeon]
MPKKILVVRNIPRESLGFIAQFLREKNIAYDIIDADDTTNFPNLVDYGGVIIFGGPDSANDKTPKIVKELEFVGKCVEQKVPYLGICLGMQVLVAVVGGTVYVNEANGVKIKEIGVCDESGEFYEVDLTLAGRYDQLFAGIEEHYAEFGVDVAYASGSSDPFVVRLKIFQMHGETVELLPNYGMQCLATGKHCKNQIVKVDENAYGIQGHFEVDEETFNSWVAEDDEIKQMDIGKMKTQYEKAKQEYFNNAKLIFGNWLKIAGY